MKQQALHDRQRSRCIPIIPNYHAFRVPDASALAKSRYSPCTGSSY